MLGLVVLAVVAAPQQVLAEGRPAALFSYCGFGKGPADSAFEPGGGGDTLVVSDPEDIYHFLYDSSSPVTLAEHDRVIFQKVLPRELSFRREGDHLVICHQQRLYELVIDSHYCRAARLSDTDVDNNEVEELAFIAEGEIWLSDLLFAEWLKAPGSYPPSSGADASDYERPAGSPPWRIRRFSDVLPEASKRANGCPSR